MSQLGRISGPLLKANLLRQGVDLAFETDLLYLDVNNRRIGIKTATPTHELQVNGTLRTTNLEVVGTTAQLGDFTFSPNTITYDGDLTFNLPEGSALRTSKFSIDAIDIFNNIIATNESNANLEIRPSGTGIVDVKSGIQVTGSLQVDGAITADGNITLGDANTDTLTINAEINSNLIPDANETYQIGSDPDLGGKRWNDVWTRNLFADVITSQNLIIDGVNISALPGNIYYVSAVNGSDTHEGEHPNDTLATIKYALTLASAGDTVYLYPGVYEEEFPLEIPVGVTLKGVGIRSVKVVPTNATKYNNAFLMNGETTVEDLTVADFFYDSINDTGYAFSFANNFTVTTRSPYIRNISVLTKGSVTTPEDPLGFNQGDAGHGAKADGSIANAASKEASMLFHSVTFITPGSNALSCTNGVRIEWLNSFTYFADKGMELYSSNDGFAGIGKTRVKITDRTGTFNVGNTLTYYDIDGTTVLASGVIESIDGDFLNIDGKSLGWATVEDRAGKTVSVAGNAKLSTAIKKFGSASLALDGVGDYITYASQPDFAYSTNAFTIEMWVYRTVSGVVQVLLDQRTSVSTTYAPLIFITATNVLAYGEGTIQAITGITTVPLNAWSHVAVSRSGTSTRLFLNGVQQGSTYTDTRNYIATPVSIGIRFDRSTLPFTGYIDEVRISKGIARYTGTFTPPTNAFTSDTSTVLLLHFNGTNNSTIIVDDGITTQDIRTSAGGTASIIDLADYSDFGAELRSIGSACVYGNYGVYGDGDGVIAYLIGQNLAYIGLGGDSSNDPGLVIQANEVTQLNRAKIYYTSVDHKGDFRVGEQFYINQDTGEVIFSNSNVAVTGSLLFNDGVNQTYIDATKIETGDFRISNNTVETLSQVMNINSFTGEVNFLNNVNIAGDLDVTGNVTIGGNITIGDQTTDTVNIEARIDSDIVPKLNDTYNLGTTIERWRQIFVNRLTADNIEIVDNKISTLDSNSDLELLAAGTGRVLIPNNNLQVNETFTVLGTTNLQDTNVTGTLILTGDANITGNVVQNGDLSVSGSFFSASLDLENIEIVQNNIRTKNSNQDLQLEAAGTGRIYVPSNDVQIDQTLTVDGLITGTTITNSGTVTSTTIRNENIVIAGNTVATTLSNSNLEIRSNGTGKIYISSSDLQIDEDLEVIGTTNLSTTNVTGTLTVVGNIVQTGNYTQTGDLTVTGNLSVDNAAQFENILIDNNVITTTESNSDLELRANGSGIVIIDGTDLEVTGNLDIVGTLSANSLNITTDITADRYTNGNILIENNVISTTLSNSDLELRADGSGDVEITSDLVINENMFVSGTATLAATIINGTILHVGDLIHTGSAVHTGDYTLNGNLTVSSFAQFENIRIDGNQLSTTDSNSNLELIASGSGIVSIPSNNVIVGQDLTVNGSLTVENLSLTILETEIVQTSDIRIQNNFVTTTLSNSDLELRANGTGRVLIPTADFVVENDLTVQGDTELQTTTITGTLIQNGNTVHTGDTTQTGNYILNGNLDVSGLAEIADIQINGNQISSKSGYNLVLDAPGSGIVYVPENDVLIENDLFVNGTLYANNIIGTFGSLQSNEIDTGDIVVRGNRITTTLSNSDLELRANGAGSVIIDGTDLIVNGGLVVNPDAQLNNTQITGTLTHTGIANHTGTVNQTGAFNLTGNIDITGTAQFNNIRVEGNVISTTTPGSDLTFQATGAGIINVPFNDVRIAQNLSVTGDITTTDIVASNSISAPTLTLGSVTISGNLITTNVSNSNLELRANGVGAVEIESIVINQNQITTQTDTNLVIAPNGTGIVDFQGTQAVRLPRGTDGQRPTGLTGQVRYNTDRNYYEGFDGSNWRRLDGVYDLDENTYITPETTPGANDNTISFYINGLNKASLTATTFSTSNLDIGNINITGNTVSTTNTDGNLVLAPNGTGSTVIGFFALRNNTITNTQADTITSFNQTGTGYFKIAGTNGFVLPRGRVDQRGALVETGMMRFNTTDSRVEVYDGSQWVSAAGSSGSGITLSEAEGLAITTALIFG